MTNATSMTERTAEHAEAAGTNTQNEGEKGSGGEYRSGDARVRGLIRHLDYLARTADQRSESRAALAELRQAVRDPLRGAKHVAPFLGPVEEILGRRERQHTEELWFYRIASLFALHRRHENGMSLGRAFRRIAEQRGSDSIEGRFTALLSAARDDQLEERLRGAVTLLAADSEPLDWCRVLDDVLQWDRPGRPCQHRLAREYYYRPAEED